MLRHDPIPEDLAQSFDQLRGWLDTNGWEGHDVCDVGGHPLFMGLEHRWRRGGVLGSSAFLARHAGLRLLPLALWRRVLSIEPAVYPQALGNLAAAWVRSRHRVDDAKSRARDCLKHLRKHPSKCFEGLSWGQPYDWVSNIIIPRDTPRATVTSIVGHAFLDAYEAWGDPMDLEAAVGAGEFMLNGLNRTVDADQDFCFSYTNIDHYCVHNASMVAAGLLARCGALAARDDFLDAAMRASRYTVKHQMPDGAWDYRGPPDVQTHRIDNYHSGFVVESLALVDTALGDRSPFRPALDKGLAFYREHLFMPDGLPKTYPHAAYPVNVQSAAQAIITFAELARRDPDLLQDAVRVARWTVNALQASDGHFGYKLFASGRRDMTPYIRWTESWMARALASLIMAHENGQGGST